MVAIDPAALFGGRAIAHMGTALNDRLRVTSCMVVVVVVKRHCRVQASDKGLPSFRDIGISHRRCRKSSASNDWLNTACSYEDYVLSAYASRTIILGSKLSSMLTGQPVLRQPGSSCTTFSATLSQAVSDLCRGPA